MNMYVQGNSASSTLPLAFFARPAPEVARDLLGKYLVRTWRGKEHAYCITETEAYHGHEDQASHAHKGLTKRNAVMFGPAGYFYVYLIYGMYDMLNIVTGDDGTPSAVLVRGVEGYDGPGKLTRHLHVGRALSGAAAVPQSGLWIEDRGAVVDHERVAVTPRIGVAYAGPEWAQKPYRFVLKDSA